MLVLGIETSGQDGSVALLKDDECLEERRLNRVGHRHAQSLVLEIGDLLRNSGYGPRDVNLVAVSRGPGSFTGLRVGMVCAKTFAYATGCRFISVDTFSAIAENVSMEMNRVHVIEDAQRDDLFAGEYHRGPTGEWEIVAPIRIVASSDFLQQRSDSDIITGPGIRKLIATETSRNWLSDPAICQPRASIIARIGHRNTTRQSTNMITAETDFWQASPFYLRLSAAEEKRASLGT